MENTFQSMIESMKAADKAANVIMDEYGMKRDLILSKRKLNRLHKRLMLFCINSSSRLVPIFLKFLLFVSPALRRWFHLAMELAHRKGYQKDFPSLASFLRGLLGIDADKISSKIPDPLYSAFLKARKDRLMRSGISSDTHAT